MRTDSDVAASEWDALAEELDMEAAQMEGYARNWRSRAENARRQAAATRERAARLCCPHPRAERIYGSVNPSAESCGVCGTVLDR